MTFEQQIVVPASEGLETLIVGHEILAFDATPSTNTIIRQQAAQGAAEGLVAIADEQTAGRGRRGRSWSTPAGVNLLQSFLFRPSWLQPQELWLLTALAAVAVHDAIRQVTGITTHLKWPNDVLLEDRKLAGILLEAETHEQRVHWAIVGCGINVNWYPQHDPELALATTSLAEYCGKNIERATLFRALLQQFDQQYLALRNGRREHLRQRWLELLITIGQRVQVETNPNQYIYGIAETVELNGALRLRLDNGETQQLFAGDVRLRPQ